MLSRLHDGGNGRDRHAFVSGGAQRRLAVSREQQRPGPRAIGFTTNRVDGYINGKKAFRVQHNRECRNLY